MKPRGAVHEGTESSPGDALCRSLAIHTYLNPPNRRMTRTYGGEEGRTGDCSPYPDWSRKAKLPPAHRQLAYQDLSGLSDTDAYCHP